MRIVDRKTFLAMPAGTVFRCYEPCIFDEICVKGATLPFNDGRDHDGVFADFYYEQVGDHAGNIDDVMDATESGASFPVDPEGACQRDAMFEPKQLFCVLDAADVGVLVRHLQKALADGYAG